MLQVDASLITAIAALITSLSVLIRAVRSKV